VSNRVKVVIGLVGVIALTGVAVFFFLRYQIRKSFPETSGTLSIEGLHDRVEVLRDTYGVPRIEARDEHDLIMTLGYVHAQDRLWQMDMACRIAEGRLSELFGRETLPFDKLFRLIGIRQIAEKVELALPAESRDRLQWYAHGVNAFILTHRGKYPIEFDLLSYDPEQWTPVHSVMVGKFLAWQMTLSWWTELTYGAIADRVGPQMTLDIFPPYPPDVQPAVRSWGQRGLASAGMEFLHAAEAFGDYFGMNGILGGSNAWVVGPSKSASGKVILANDTHLVLQNPCLWYEVHLQVPEFTVAGMSVPGAPGILAGYNDHIAWGITNAMVDDADFYVERIDSSDTTKYVYDGALRPITFREEEIQVRGDTAVTFVVRSTHHGPIVTDIAHPLQKFRYPLVTSMRWTGAEEGDQAGAFMKIDKAENWEEFSAGVREFPGPGQNFVYGDQQGNIGYRCGALLPIRGKQSSALPLPGWEKSTEWRGFVPSEKLPAFYNPPEGFVASANDKIAGDEYPYYISYLWEPPSRIQRLRSTLGKDDRFSVEDFKQLQNDTFSMWAKEIVPYILEACKDSLGDLSDNSHVLDYLRNWTFTFDRENIAAMIYQECIVQLLENTYKDEMGEELFHDWLILSNIPIRVTTKLLRERTSPWFDDASTDSVETRDQVIRKSLQGAVAALRERFGPDPKTWRWGDAHTVTLQHPFGLRKPLDKIFNIGPFPYRGGSTTLISGEYSFNQPFAAIIGATFRQIVDFARPGEAEVVLTSGQSGQVFHPHYADQTPLWLNGAYRTVRAKQEQGEAWDMLVLEPIR
jgi:penicillin amidase